MEYRAFGRNNISQISQFEKINPLHKKRLSIISRILPFRVNNYIIDELIDWNNIPEDPIFQLTFPQPEMLARDQLDRMEEVLKRGGSQQEIRDTASLIQRELNPTPAMQKRLNVPVEDGLRMEGMQHKYTETLLFFPREGQMCAAYCTYCFRWAQFMGLREDKFSSSDPQLLFRYIDRHPGITDLLFTGGDPLSMKASRLRQYIAPLLKRRPGNLSSIRFGTKYTAFWPYRFTSDKDAEELLRLFEEIVKGGYHLAVMSHYSHPRELSTPVSRQALEKIRATGAEVRCQAPVIRHINDSASVWRELWKRQVRYGAVPYYMFMARDTGPRDYFSVPIRRAFSIYTEAYRTVSGLARTVRGPVMSTSPGKILMDGYTRVNGKKAMVLKFIQGRDPRWVNKPFFAADNPRAIWLDDLVPLEGKKFFFEKEMEKMIRRTRNINGGSRETEGADAADGVA